MSEIIRFGVSMDQQLVDRFDKMIGKQRYANRSEAIRDLIRAALVEQEWATGSATTVGTVCLVYDHGASDLSHRLNRIQHDSPERVVASLHVHLDPHNCLEIVVLKGKASQIKKISDQLRSLRGVKHAQLVMGTSGKRLA